MRKFISPIALSLFVLCYLVNHFLGWAWVLIIPGIVLLFFLPGYNLNSIIFRFGKTTKINFVARLGLDIASSIAVLSLLNMVLSSRIGFRENSLTLFVFITNLLLALISYFVLRNAKHPKPPKISRAIWIAWLVPVFLFVIRVLLNPYIFEIDSLHYIEAYTDILRSGADTGYLFKGRQAFPFYFSASHYLAGFNYTAFFKFFTPTLFYLGAGTLFAALDRPRRPWLVWLYLLILSAPMVTIMNEGVRPETFCLIFTIPVLVTSFLAIRNNDVRFALLSALYAVTAFRFHEAALILILTVGLTVLTMLAINARTIGTAIRNNRWVSLAIAIPYLILARTYINDVISLFNDNVIIKKFYTIFKNGISNIDWNWWFLDNTTTDLGAKISWPGFSAIWYYLYGGVTVLLFLVILLVSRRIFRKQNKTKEVGWIPLIPVAGFLVVHLALAELFPRFGILIMYNRSWPYIALGSAVLAMILGKRFFRSDRMTTVDRWLFAGIMVCAISGIAGSLYGSTFMGGMVLPQEKQAIKSIKSLPENSLVVSTQRNNNLVQIYGQRNFVQIVKNPQMTNEGFEDQSKELTIEAINKRMTILKSMQRVYRKTTTRILFNNDTATIDSELENLKGSPEKLPLLEKYQMPAYRILIDKLNYLESAKSQDVYLLYSFAKLDHGLLATRGWWRTSSDEKNYDLFKNYSGETIAKDDNFVLIKIDLGSYETKQDRP